MTNAGEQSERVVVALDVGGTGLKGGVFDARSTVVCEARERTGAGDGPDAVLERVVGLLDRLRGEAAARGRSVAGVGIVVPGLVDDAAGTAVWSANLGWRDVALGPRVEQALGLPVAVGHDVRAGALAEGALGAARSARDWLFLPVGTGIAAAVSLDGRPHAHSPFAGEIGHVVVDRDGPRCTCGARGCLETIASARAIATRYAERAGRATAGEGRVEDVVRFAASSAPRGEDVPAGAAPAEDVASGNLRAEDVARLAAGGDPVAAAVWQEAVDALATAIAWASAVLALDLVVVGGGLSAAGPALLEPLTVAVGAALTYQPPPRIVAAALGDRAGCLGASMLAWERAEGAVG